METKKRKRTDKDKIAKALENFRASVKENGYEGITREMVPLVTKHGTLKDKAALCIIGNLDMVSERLAPIVTDDEVEVIRGWVQASNPINRVVWANAVWFYRALFAVRMRYNELWAQICMNTNYCALLLAHYEWIGKTLDYNAEVIHDVDEAKAKEFNEASLKMADYIASYKGFSEATKDTPTCKWSVDLEREAMLNEARAKAKLAANCIEIAKGIASAVEFSAMVYDGDLYVPTFIAKITSGIKASAFPFIPSRYHFNQFYKIKKEGRRPTSEERKLAFVREWDDCKISEEAYAFFINFIKKHE